MSAFVQYSVNRVKAYFGVIDLTRAADRASGVRIRALTPVWKIVRGTGGVFTRMRASHFDCELSVNIQAQTSTHADLLETLQIDALTGFGALPTTFIDTHTGTSYVCPAGVLTEFPDASAAEGAPYHQWKIYMASTVIGTVGGTETGLVSPFRPT